MIGGMGPIQMPAQSTIADLIVLLDFIKDPKALSSALEDLKQKMEALTEKQAEMGALEPALKKAKEENDAKTAELKKWSAHLSSLEAQLSAKTSALDSREKHVSFKESELQNKKIAAEKEIETALNMAAHREQQANIMKMELEEAIKNAEAKKAEFEAKIEKMKQMVGA